MNTNLLDILNIKIEEDTKELIHQLPDSRQEISIMKLSVLEDDAAYQAALDQELIDDETADENLFMWRVEDDYTAAEWYGSFNSARLAFASMIEYYYGNIVEALDENLMGMIDITAQATPDEFAERIEICLMTQKHGVSRTLAWWIVAEFRAQWPAAFAAWYAEACHIAGSENADVHVPEDMLPLAEKMADLHRMSVADYIRHLIEMDVAGYRPLRLKAPRFNSLTADEVASVTGTTTLQEAEQAGIEFLTDGEEDD